MFIQSDKIEGRVNEAVGARDNDESFKRQGKAVNVATQGGPKMLAWQVEPNGWDEV